MPRPRAWRRAARTSGCAAAAPCSTWTPAVQLAVKEQELREILERVARLSPGRWLAPLTGPVWGYRRRARLGAKFVRKKGRSLVGFRERSAPYVAELERCEVLAAPAGELIRPLAAAARYPHHPRAAAADRGCGGRQRHRAGAARAGEPRGGGPRAPARLCPAHGVRIYLQTAGLESVAPLEPYADAAALSPGPFDLTLALRPPTSSR